MTLIGLDLNASRVRAVAGRVGDFPCTIPLAPPDAVLPLCVHREGRSLTAGHGGLRLCRRQPHLVCRNFLASLGDPAETGRQWLHQPQGVDSVAALELVLRQIQPACQRSPGVVLALPAYLRPEQLQIITALAERVKIPLLGSLTTSLACALTAYAEQAWFGTALVVDADDHAMTLAAVQDSNGKAHLLGHVSLPDLGLGAWKGRLLDALADCCILQSRRDPRDSPAAEQSLFDQLDGIVEDCRQGRLVHVVFQTEHWYQNLVLQPEDTRSFCVGLVGKVLGEVSLVLQASWPKGPPRTILLSAAAGRLPGLVPALVDHMEAWERLTARDERETPEDEDFGAGLLDGGGEMRSVVVLSPEAAARGAHGLAVHFQRGDLARSHLDGIAPLPLPQPPEAGPARLQLEGQDIFLRERSFILGRQPDCDLVFDRARYAHVSAHHCEILYDPEGYELRDHSREGTWVNDRPVIESVPLRPGDWIRLGPDGPLLRFLGQPGETNSGNPAAGSGQWAVGGE
jgi:hypothetical protein